MRKDRRKKYFRDRMHEGNVVRVNNYMAALHMLCIKAGWDKEYSWYILRRDEGKCANGGREAFVKKATRLLAFNYEGIHSGANPILSPRLLPESTPGSMPLRYPPEFQKENAV